MICAWAQTSLATNYELHWICNESLGFALGFASMHFALWSASLIESAVAYNGLFSLHDINSYLQPLCYR